MSLRSKEILIAFVLAVGLLFSSWFFWSNWDRVLLNPAGLLGLSGDLLWLLLLTLVGFLLYLTAICLTAILPPNFWLRLLVLESSVVTLLLVFRQLETVFLVATLVLLVFGLMIFVWQAQREIEAHLKMRLGHIFQPFLSTFLLLLIIVMSLQTFAVSRKANFDFKVEIPPILFNQIMQKVGGLSNLNNFGEARNEGFLPNQKVKGTTDMDLQAIFEGKAPLPPEVRSYFEKGQLPPEVLAELQKQGVSAEMINEVMKGITVDSQGYLKPKITDNRQQITNNKEQITDNKQGAGLNLMDVLSSQLKNEVEKQINSMIAPYKQYLPLVLAVSVFLTLLTIKGILASLVIMLFSIIVILLQLIKVVKIEKKEVEAERLVI